MAIAVLAAFSAEGWSAAIGMLWGDYGDVPHERDVMTLVALLSAQAVVAESNANEPEVQLAATLQIAGMTVIERQAEAAVAAGCVRILILVDRLPAALITAIDRLRAHGFDVGTVRDGEEVRAALVAMDGAQSVKAVILVADGLIAPSTVWATLSAASIPTMLAAKDSPATSGMERIDGQWRWAGLASVAASDAAILAEVPTDWDPQLALLRNAIQQSAPNMACDVALFERGDILVVDKAAASHLAEQRMLSVATDDETGLINAAIIMPIARMSVRALLKGQHSGSFAHAVALASALLVIGLLWLRYPFAAAIVGITGSIAAGVAAAVATFRVETERQRMVAVIGKWTGYAAIAATGLIHEPGRIGEQWVFSLSLMTAIILASRMGERLPASGHLLPDTAMVWLILVGGAILGLWSLSIAVALLVSIIAIVIAVEKQPFPSR